MLRRKRLTGGILVFALCAEVGLGAVRGEKASYLGGTVATIPEGTQGALNLDDPKVLRFLYGGKIYELPYTQVATLEFGQKVGRRVGSTVALGVATLGVMALPMLFSKKKKHYLTVGFKNEDGSGGAAIFELSKNIVRTVIPTLEARTGKKVELEEGTAKQGKEKS